MNLVQLATVIVGQVAIGACSPVQLTTARTEAAAEVTSESPSVMLSFEVWTPVATESTRGPQLFAKSTYVWSPDLKSAPQVVNERSERPQPFRVVDWVAKDSILVLDGKIHALQSLDSGTRSPLHLGPRSLPSLRSGPSSLRLLEGECFHYIGSRNGFIYWIGGSPASSVRHLSATSSAQPPHRGLFGAIYKRSALERSPSLMLTGVETRRVLAINARGIWHASKGDTGCRLELLDWNDRSQIVWQFPAEWQLSSLTALPSPSAERVLVQGWGPPQGRVGLQVVDTTSGALCLERLDVCDPLSSGWGPSGLHTVWLSDDELEVSLPVDGVYRFEADGRISFAGHPPDGGAEDANDRPADGMVFPPDGLDLGPPLRDRGPGSLVDLCKRRAGSSDNIKIGVVADPSAVWGAFVFDDGSETVLSVVNRRSGEVQDIARGIIRTLRWSTLH